MLILVLLLLHVFLYLRCPTHCKTINLQNTVLENARNPSEAVIRDMYIMIDIIIYNHIYIYISIYIYIPVPDIHMHFPTLPRTKEHHLFSLDPGARALALDLTAFAGQNLRGTARSVLGTTLLARWRSENGTFPPLNSHFYQEN